MYLYPSSSQISLLGHCYLSTKSYAARQTLLLQVDSSLDCQFFIVIALVSGSYPFPIATNISRSPHLTRLRKILLEKNLSSIFILLTSNSSFGIQYYGPCLLDLATIKKNADPYKSHLFLPSLTSLTPKRSMRTSIEELPTQVGYP